jgi:citrate lyase subunit beta/citryl-CoA lyase
MARPDPASLPLRRSLLFVPAAEPRKIERARTAGADTIILDLEDAVAPAEKATARARVTETLRAGGVGAAELAVRINGFGSAEFEADLAAVLAGGGRTIMLPKAESAEQIRAVAAALDRLEGLVRTSGGTGVSGTPAGDSAVAAAMTGDPSRPGASARGMVAGETTAGESRGGGPTTGAPPGGRSLSAVPVKLLLLIETPRGIADALAVAGASARAEALCFGHVDFSLAMGLAEADATQGICYHARCALALAAKAMGLAPIDTVHLAVKDAAAFRDDAERGRGLGFEGKLCIHPQQVEIANAVYTPTPAQIEHALRVLDAAKHAEAEGRGVFALDGRMIDAPVVAVERRVLERARRAGVLRE